MPIYLSASSIKDFLSCSYKYKYRRYNKTEAKETVHMKVGTIVHSLLEKGDDTSLERLIDLGKGLAKNEELEDKEVRKIEHCLRNFYKSYREILSDRDQIETFFKIPYNSDITILGKLDRILEKSIVIDWKTGKLPINLSSDPQFIIYDWAFEKLYGYRASNILAVSLENDSTKYYSRVDKYFNLLMDEIVPHIHRRITSKDFQREGRFLWRTCNNCSFLDYCNYELASRNTTERKIQN